MSGDGKENAQCSTAHNLPLLQNWNYTFLSWPSPVQPRPRVCLSTLLWSFSNIG